MAVHGQLCDACFFVARSGANKSPRWVQQASSMRRHASDACVSAYKASKGQGWWGRRSTAALLADAGRMFLQSVARGAASSSRGSVAQRRGRLRPVGSDGFPTWEMPVVMGGSSRRRREEEEKKKKKNKKKGPAVNAAKERLQRKAKLRARAQGAAAAVAAVAAARGGGGAAAAAGSDEPVQVVSASAVPAEPLLASPLEVERVSCKSRESSMQIAMMQDQEFEEMVVPVAVRDALAGQTKDLRKSTGAFVQVQQPDELADGAQHAEVYIVGSELQRASARESVTALAESASPPVPNSTDGGVLIAQAIPFQRDQPTLEELSRVCGVSEDELVDIGSARVVALMKEHSVLPVQQQIILREIAARKDAAAKGKKGRKTAYAVVGNIEGETPTQYQRRRDAAGPKRRHGAPTHLPAEGETWRGRRPGTPPDGEARGFADEAAARRWADKQANAGEFSLKNVFGCCGR